jgi:uncharacterized metal-binding protein
MPNQKKSDHLPACASCDLPIFERICFTKDGKGAKGCPSLTRTSVLKKSNALYKDKDIKHFAHMASAQEAACYANRDQQPYVMQPSKTRIVEICEFAHRMKYTRLGLAFCLGLTKEAKVVEEIFTGYGYEVVSVCCKAGRSSKDLIDITEDEKIFKGTDEAMCNPIFQAKVLDADKTDLNILLGLCVGHDTLFFQHTNTPTTVLAVKDRVTGHNPLAAIYQSESYYQKIRCPDIASPGITGDRSSRTKPDPH